MYITFKAESGATRSINVPSAAINNFSFETTTKVYSGVQSVPKLFIRFKHTPQLLTDLLSIVKFVNANLITSLYVQEPELDINSEYKTIKQLFESEVFSIYQRFFVPKTEGETIYANPCYIGVDLVNEETNINLLTEDVT